MANAPFITLNNVTVRLRDRWLLQGTRWQICRGEQWVVWGANGAGKTTLARTLMGHMPVVQGEVLRHYLEDPAVCAGRGSMALVSAEQSHQLYEQERWLAEMRHFSGRLLERTTAGDLLSPDAGTAPAAQSHRDRIFAAFDLTALLDKPMEALSSGEMRKVLLARALLHDPCLLILDEPFNGLDAASQTQLGQILRQLSLAGRQMVLITHRLAEISDLFTHVLQLEEGRVTWQGEKQAFFQRIARTDAGPPIEGRAATGAPIPAGAVAETPLIEMRDVTVSFGDQIVLDQVNWTGRPGENWALIGPNGAGKSTLLALITGDQLQAYANEITLFGRPRGSGESLWEIKQYIGQVGDTLQARYQRRVTAFDVICSGFFDSVGLYRNCDEAQRRTARQWVERLSLA
ncbi:MAG: ATP-binding cassette domain-containing protein, partial [Desulfatitalea sp.]